MKTPIGQTRSSYTDVEYPTGSQSVVQRILTELLNMGMFRPKALAGKVATSHGKFVRIRYRPRELEESYRYYIYLGHCRFK